MKPYVCQSIQHNEANWIATELNLKVGFCRNHRNPSDPPPYVVVVIGAWLLALILTAQTIILYDFSGCLQ